MNRHKILILLALCLVTLLLAGCGQKPPESPADKMLNTIIDILVYAAITTFLTDMIFGIVGVKLGKPGRVIVTVLGVIVYSVLSFQYGKFPFPGF